MKQSCASVISLKSKVSKLFGIDKAVSFSLALRLWNGISMPVTLILIAKHLTQIEQGYYYSFAGVQGLAVLAELGIAFVISQFAAHENASMHAANKISSEDKHVHAARLASILKLGILWNVVTFILCIFLLIPGGIWFFSGAKDSQSIQWLLPWMLFATFSSMGIILSPVYAVLNGIGYIGDTSTIQFIQTVVSTIAAWTMLATGFKLFALVAMPFFGVLGGVIGILVMHRKTIYNIINDLDRKYKVCYWSEIFPLQSKVALSWISGYVGFYFSTPLIFRTLSPQVAGQYGMSTNLLLSISGVAAIWVNTQSPAFAKLAAIGDISLLRRDFILASARSLFIILSGYICIYSIQNIEIFNSLVPFNSRLLPSGVLLIFMASYLLSHISGLLNTYLRSFKLDPLFWLAISNAIITVSLLYATGQKFGINGVAWLFFIINMISCIAATFYYFKPEFGKNR